MLTAISRYGARMHPTTQQIVAGCRERGEFIQGPQIAAFEGAFAARLGACHAVTASYGRTAWTRKASPVKLLTSVAPLRHLYTSSSESESLPRSRISGTSAPS